jgi:thioredoxin reductase (NADPH)
MTYQSDICIIGAGPVGLFAAFEAGMHGIKSIIVDSLPFAGGQCSALYPEKPIYDIPAYPSILGKDLSLNLKEQADRFSPQYFFDTKIISYTQNQDKSFTLKSDKNQSINVKAIIIAAGSGFFGPNRPPISNIENFEGKTVHYLVSDKSMFKDKTIVIAGGGDSAIDWTAELAGLAKKIYLVHRRDKFRAAQHTVDKVFNLAKQSNVVELVIPYQLHGIDGNNGILSSVSVSSIDGTEIKKLEADFLLPFFGLSTDFGPLKNWGLEFDGFHIKTEQSTMQTNIDGIFAIGDAATYKNKLKLILTGFAEAATAVYQIRDIVFPGKVFNFEYSTSSLA